MLVDANNDEASESEKESWKKGKMKLYTANYTIGVKYVSTTDLDDETLSQMTGIGFYADGGSVKAPKNSVSREIRSVIDLLKPAEIVHKTNNYIKYLDEEGNYQEMSRDSAGVWHKIMPESVEPRMSRMMFEEDVYEFKNGGGLDDYEEYRQKSQNLEILVRAKFAVALGIDRAMNILNEEYTYHPFQIIKDAVRHNLMSLDEINKAVCESAIEAAEDVTERYADSGEGFGSSDHTYVLKEALDGAGLKTDFVNHRLKRVDDKGNVIEYDNKFALGGTLLAGAVGAYVGYKIGRAKPQKKGFETEKRYAQKLKEKFGRSKNKFAKGGRAYRDDVYHIVKDSEGNYRIAYLGMGELAEKITKDSFVQIQPEKFATREDALKQFFKIQAENPFAVGKDSTSLNLSEIFPNIKFAKGGEVKKYEYVPHAFIYRELDDPNFTAERYTPEEVESFIEDFNNDMGTDYANWEDFNKGEEYRNFEAIMIRQRIFGHGGSMTNENWVYWKVEKMVDGELVTTYEKTHVASPNIPNAKEITKQEYEANKYAKGGVTGSKHFVAQENGILGIYSGSDAYSIQVTKGDEFVTVGDQGNSSWWYVKKVDKNSTPMSEENTWEGTKKNIRVNWDKLILTFPKGDKMIYAEMKEKFAKGGRTLDVTYYHVIKDRSGKLRLAYLGRGEGAVRISKDSFIQAFKPTFETYEEAVEYFTNEIYPTISNDEKAYGVKLLDSREINLFAKGGGVGIKLGDIVEVKEPNYGYDSTYYVVDNKAGYDRDGFLISQTQRREGSVFEEDQLNKLYAKGGKTKQYWKPFSEDELSRPRSSDFYDFDYDSTLLSGNIWISFSKEPKGTTQIPYEVRSIIQQQLNDYVEYDPKEQGNYSKNMSLREGSWFSLYIEVENMTSKQINDCLMGWDGDDDDTLSKRVSEALEEKGIKGYGELGFYTYGKFIDLEESPNKYSSSDI
jgi:hypothetical protein